MERRRALIISIGTGTRRTAEAVESLASGITYSIEANNPDKLFLIASKQSEDTTVSHIIDRINIDYEIILVSDADDIQGIYQTLYPLFKQVREEFSYLTVDYTSGTKAMTSALAILGTAFEAESLSYVAGKREGGIVIKGTERLHTVRPYFATLEGKIKDAVKFFNECRFDTSLAMINQISQTTQDPTILNQLSDLKSASLAYSAWDRFEHQQAFHFLEKVKLPSLNHNKAFLGKLLHYQQTKTSDTEPFLIADLLNNAQRRGGIESKYDDAVARLYRTIELIAQYELKRCGIPDSGNVLPTEIPSELASKWKITSKEKIKIGLEKDYELLAAKGRGIGVKFVADNKLRDLLSRRNFSILAHGLQPVGREVYQELWSKVLDYATMAVANLEQLLSDSLFVQWQQ
jgi:CRISPR-associated protein (TIGR02710 family)